MKTNYFSLGFLVIGMTTMTLPAQTCTVLHTFTSNQPGSGSWDGANPYGGLVLVGNTLYGTTHAGGTSGNGTVFSLNTNRSAYTVLHTFTAMNNNANLDGSYPWAGLIVAGNTLFGTTTTGGTNGWGTVFSLNTDGSAFTVLHTFSAMPDNNTNPDGATPTAGLLLASNTLYGTTHSGGTNGCGTVFLLNTNGSNFTVLYTFSSQINKTHLDGAHPYGGVVLGGNTLYGTTYGGGTNGWGTVFSLDTSGSSFSVLHTFTNGLDDAYPYSGLVLAGHTLYGTTDAGGSSKSYGTVFSVDIDGSSYAVLRAFPGGLGGANPIGDLVLFGDTLYGTTYTGSTIFSVNTNGATFTILYKLSGSEGANPWASLTLANNTLFGTTQLGALNYGTVFSLRCRN